MRTVILSDNAAKDLRDRHPLQIRRHEFFLVFRIFVCPVLFFHRLVLPIDGLHKFFRIAKLRENRVEFFDRYVDADELFLRSVAVRTPRKIASDKNRSECGRFFNFQIALCFVEIVVRERRDVKVGLVTCSCRCKLHEVRVRNLRVFSVEVLQKIRFAENLEVDAPVFDMLTNPRNPGAFKIARNLAREMPETAGVHHLRFSCERRRPLPHSEQRL